MPLIAHRQRRLFEGGPGIAREPATDAGSTHAGGNQVGNVWYNYYKLNSSPIYLAMTLYRFFFYDSWHKPLHIFRSLPG